MTTPDPIDLLLGRARQTPRPYTSQELVAAEQRLADKLADRMLHDAPRPDLEVARVAQEAILQPVTAQIDGVQVCTRYHCAVPQPVVGGDVYDIAHTPFGLRVLVGNVHSHEPDAIGLTAATLGAFRDLASTTTALPALATTLDALLSPQLGQEDFVTAILAEFAPNEVRLVNCGHPAPLRAGGGQIKLLEPAVPAPPLGLHPTPQQNRIRLRAGNRLLFYTNGLAKARDRHGMAFPLLERAQAPLAEPLPADVLDTLYDQVRAHTQAPLTDDLALVLCQPADILVPDFPSAQSSDTRSFDSELE